MPDRLSTALTFALLGAALSGASAVAQTPVVRAPPTQVEQIVIGQKVTVTSKILGEDRPVWIHLPDDYNREPGRYPVIYKLDGEDNFTEFVGIVTRLARAQRMPDAIIIAVPNTKDRTHDLTPDAASDSFRTAYQEGSPEINTRYYATRGGANKFRAFLTQELAPWVERHYRTEPYRVLFGHSFGGLFVLDAISREPQSFTAYVATSPSLWWDNGRYLQTIQEGLARGPLTSKSLYITTGGRELVDAMIKPPQALAAYLQRSPPAGLRWSFRVMPGEVHSTNPHRSQYDALEWLFEGFEINDSAIVALSVRNDSMPLVRHFAGLSKQLGYTVPYPVSMLNGRAHFYLTSKKPEQAMRLFRFNVAHAPESPTAHGGLADGLEAVGQKEGAIEAATKALQLATAAKDSSAAKYQAQIARLKK